MGEPAGREAALLAELQHRVRNTLAMTRMIARRSAETSVSLDGYVAHLDGRLAALARVQNAAIRDPVAGIALNLLVADEITSAGLGTDARLRFSGPTLAIHPRAAEPIALAVHELMTNALKFGALSVPAGRLAIAWRLETSEVGPRTIAFDWIETGLHLVESADRPRGFGTIVLLDMLKHNLGARTDLRFEATGLVCQIQMPATDRILAS